MKKYFLGIITGFIACTMLVSAVAIANSPISLIVNGNVVESDVPPQIIDGRTMVPARPLAEALGADVRWDAESNAVVVTGGVQTGAVPTDLDPVREVDNTAEKMGGEVKMDEWIDLNNFVVQSGSFVKCGGDLNLLVIEKGDFDLKVSCLDIPADETPYTASTPKGNLKIKRLDDRFYINIADLRNIGLLQ